MAGTIRLGTAGWVFEPWRKSFYPEGLKQKDELAYSSRAARQYRDQRHLLFAPEGGELRELGRPDARTTSSSR